MGTLVGRSRRTVYLLWWKDKTIIYNIVFSNLLNHIIMANAKKEFIEHTSNKIVKCAMIDYSPHTFSWDEEEKVHTVHMLPVDYTQEEYDEFVNSLDFMYDDGYGLQELYGYIWFTDGTWSDRHEYDGSEHWDYHRAPGIPVSLIKSTF